MTSTMPTAAELEQQLVATREAEAQATAQATASMRAREITFRRARLATYDAATLAAQSRRAWAEFLQALDADPVFSALADAHAARWLEKQAANTAQSDAVFLAQVDGTNAPHNPGRSDPPQLVPDTLLDAVSNLALVRIQAHQGQVDEDYAAAVYGEGLTMDEILAAEQEAERTRRQDAARSVASGSTDVTGMSDEERQRLGIPPGSTRDPLTRR